MVLQKYLGQVLWCVNTSSHYLRTPPETAEVPTFTCYLPQGGNWLFERHCGCSNLDLRPAILIPLLAGQLKWWWLRSPWRLTTMVDDIA